MKQFFGLIICLYVVVTITAAPDEKCRKGRENLVEFIAKAATRSNTPLDDITADYFLCAWEALKIMNENGKVNATELEKFIEDQLSYVTTITPERSSVIKKCVSDCDLKPRQVKTETAIIVKNCNAKIMSLLYIPVDYD
ncbi:hypothetical protein FQA39_LY04028 [Lamprigera yunnana]|nr:hypothetical protein FQA39_LY04028 [Lamprigera yunnana]